MLPKWALGACGVNSATAPFRAVFHFLNGFYCVGFIPDDSHIYFRK